MQTAIEEIYENAWELFETLPASEDYKKVKEEVYKLHDALEATLNETQKKLLDDLYMTMGGLETEASKTHFITGFNYGVKIVTQAFK